MLVLNMRMAEKNTPINFQPDFKVKTALDCGSLKLFEKLGTDDGFFSETSKKPSGRHSCILVLI